MIWLHPNKLVFPSPRSAGSDGLVAIGGDLSPERVLLAYKMGIFPWYNPNEPILWWSPDPRFVLLPENLKVARSMRPYFNQRKFRVTLDQTFSSVITACQQQYRPGQGGTWITEDMKAAYTALHHEGFAHSVEVWEGEELVGGLYGISIGRHFYGESMFARVSNASKFGFITLVRLLHARGFNLIDCQTPTRHLTSLGAEGIPRRTFLAELEKNRQADTLRGNWGALLAIED